jgi:hypothetical protein
LKIQVEQPRELSGSRGQSVHGRFGVVYRATF